MSKLKKLWSHPLLSGLEIDSADAISLHRKIILSKPIMRSIYRKWYSLFLPSVDATEHLPGPMIEIGAGASHLENYIPGIVKTDVVPHPNIHQVVDAGQLPYSDGKLRAIFVLNALHHFEYPAKFLSEAQRCLAVGGRLVITEPSNSPLQQFMIRKFHPHEYYDGSAPEWTNRVNGRLSEANNALPWIIFERDRARFEKGFPKLKRVTSLRHTLLYYFASGGLSYRSFLPSISIPLLKVLEGLVILFPFLGTEMTVVFERQA